MTPMDAVVVSNPLTDQSCSHSQLDTIQSRLRVAMMTQLFSPCQDTLSVVVVPALVQLHLIQVRYFQFEFSIIIIFMIALYHYLTLPLLFHNDYFTIINFSHND